MHFLRTFLIKTFLPALQQDTNIKGFFFDIRGKVGVTGDAKKRHFAINWGQTSFTHKNLRFTLKQGLVPSKTGIMGITTVIVF